MMPEKAYSCRFHKVSIENQKAMLRKCRATLEDSRRVTLLEYFPGHIVGSVFKNKSHISPN